MMTKNEMCQVWLNISYYFWRSESRENAHLWKFVKKSVRQSAALKSYTEALIKHDRMFDDLDGKIS